MFKGKNGWKEISSLDKPHKTNASKSSSQTRGEKKVLASYLYYDNNAMLKRSVTYRCCGN